MIPLYFEPYSVVSRENVSREMNQPLLEERELLPAKWLMLLLRQIILDHIFLLCIDIFDNSYKILWQQ